MRPIAIARVSGLTIVLLLAACRADEAGSPVSPTLLREGTRLTAVATATLEAYDEAGRVTSTRTVEPWAVDATVRAGRAAVTAAGVVARAPRVIVDDPGSLPQRAERAEDGRDDTDEDIIPPEVLASLMPTLAILDGEMSATGADEFVDSVGAHWRVVSTAAYAGAPVRVVSTYRNGALVADAILSWRKVTGGWLLSSQSVSAYGDGRRVSTLQAKLVDDPTLYSAAEGVLTAPMATVGRLAWRALCAFGPTALHAQTSCFRQGLSLAATSFTLAAATVAVGGTYPVSWLAFGGYLAVWGKWTADLMAYTECRNIRGRFAR